MSETSAKLPKNKPIFKVECCYYIVATDREEAESIAANEDDFFERHVSVMPITKYDLEKLKHGKDEIYTPK